MKVKKYCKKCGEKLSEAVDSYDEYTGKPIKIKKCMICAYFKPYQPCVPPTPPKYWDPQYKPIRKYPYIGDPPHPNKWIACSFVQKLK